MYLRYKNIFKKNTARDYLWMDDLAFLLSSMRRSLKTSDKELRKSFGIDKDYDEYWAYRKYYFKDLPPMTRAQYLDIKTYLPNDILTKVDRASMAVSLETRVPLLSKKIVEFAFALSEEDRCPNGERKGLLKKAYEAEFGKKFLNRKKQGFTMPADYFSDNKSQQEHLYKDLWIKEIK